jgi:hypothetical protein
MDTYAPPGEQRDDDDGKNADGTVKIRDDDVLCGRSKASFNHREFLAAFADCDRLSLKSLTNATLFYSCSLYYLSELHLHHSDQLVTNVFEMPLAIL